nr:MAG: RNA-dependent RNA polymerase [Wenzhou bat nodavirus 1]
MRNPFSAGYQRRPDRNSELPGMYKRGPLRRFISRVKQVCLPGWYNQVDVSDWSEVMERKKTTIPDRRKSFLKSFRLPPMTPPVKHSHPLSCVRRNIANRALIAAVKNIGLEPYMVSMSSTDKLEGNRFFYNQKDLKMRHRKDQVKGNTCYVMVDVDYYVDMNQYLATGLPIALYTVVPPALAGSIDENTWWFEGNNFVMEVHGGARYEHQLWDHSCDVVSVLDEYKNLIVYEVCTIALPDDPLHRIVFYSPQSISKYPYWTRLGSPMMAERLQVAYGDASYLRVVGKQQCCIAIAGTTTSVTISEPVLTAARLRYQAMKNPTMGELQRFLQSHVADPVISVPVVWELLSSGFAVKSRQRIASTYVYVPEEKPKSFIALVPGTECEDGTEHGMVVGPPLVEDGEAVVPRGAHANEIVTVADRVTDRVNKVEPPKYYKTLAREFVSRVVPVENLGVPENYDVVFENQNRPMQKARTAMALGTLGAVGDVVDVRAFQKKETYPEAKSARNISQVPTDHTLRLSCYTYAMKHVLKEHDWFGAANTPAQTVDRLMELATGERLVCKDYSKFDGTVSYWLYRNVARAACDRWVADQYRSEMLSLLDAEINCKATTESGVKYNTGSSRLSGSPVTSDHNTLINAFCSYAALRVEHTPDQAWGMLGLYCGDDGVDRQEVAAHVEKVAIDLGLDIKVQVRERGTPVDYCGRFFVDPWTSQDSFADFWRTAKKAHISFSNQPLSIARVNRASGYLVTDGKTPIISTYFRKMAGEEPPQTDRMTKEELLRYGNAWPQENAEAIRNAVCLVSGLDEETVRQVEESISNAVDIDHVPPRLLWLPAKCTPGFQVGDEVFSAAGPVPDCIPSVEVPVICHLEEPEAPRIIAPQAIDMFTVLKDDETKASQEQQQPDTTASDTAPADAETQPPEGSCDSQASYLPDTTDSSTQTDARPRRPRRRRDGPPRVLGNNQREGGNAHDVAVQSREERDVHVGSNGSGVQRLRRGRGGGGSGGNRGDNWQRQPQVVPRLQTRRYPPRRENDNAARTERVPGGLANASNASDQTTSNATLDVRYQRRNRRRRQRRIPAGSNTGGRQ